MIVEHARRRRIVGTPAQCRERLEALAAEYGVDEAVVVTITETWQTRVRSYELLARRVRADATELARVAPQAELGDRLGVGADHLGDDLNLVTGLLDQHPGVTAQLGDLPVDVVEPPVYPGEPLVDGNKALVVGVEAPVVGGEPLVDRVEAPVDSAEPFIEIDASFRVHDRHFYSMRPPADNVALLIRFATPSWRGHP